MASPARSPHRRRAVPLGRPYAPLSAAPGSQVGLKSNGAVWWFAAAAVADACAIAAGAVALPRAPALAPAAAAADMMAGAAGAAMVRGRPRGHGTGAAVACGVHAAALYGAMAVRAPLAAVVAARRGVTGWCWGVGL